VTLADDAPGTASATARATALVDDDTIIDSPPSLSIGSNNITVTAGQSAPLPLSVSAFDPDDTVLVKISSIPKWLTITDKFDNKTFGPGSATLTEAEVNSGLTLTSTYHGRGHPVVTFSITASNVTPGEQTISAPLSVTVMDPTSADYQVSSDKGLALLRQYLASFAPSSHGAEHLELADSSMASAHAFLAPPLNQPQHT
jgi:hypothetical protein